MSSSDRPDLSSWFAQDDIPAPAEDRVAIEDEDTVYPHRLARHEPPAPHGWGSDQDEGPARIRWSTRTALGGGQADDVGDWGPLRWSTRTDFYNGHDGGGAALLRVMVDGYRTAAGDCPPTSVIDLPYTGFEAPHSTAVRVLCVRADAMGAKIAMRTVVGESRLVVVAAQLDGVFHPRVPHAARFSFRHLEKLCPVRFMPFEHRWRSDLTARPGRRYQRAVAHLVATIEQTRSDAAAGAIPDPPPATPAAS